MPTRSPSTAANDACAERFPGVVERPWQHRTLRVPREQGAIVALPSLDRAAQSAIDNAGLLTGRSIDVQGKSLSELRAWVRDEVLGAAVRFTTRFGGAPPAAPQRSLLLADGHQPQLFHTGVWAKNFVLAGLAERLDATPLHLIVDTDTFSSTGIRVPTGSAAAPRLETILYDAPQPSRPWEDTPISDPELFDAFAERVSGSLRGWEFTPVLKEIWPAAVAARRSGETLPICLTAARIALERRWGLNNLELPMSDVCRLPSFLWFASHVLANLPCFVRFHNGIVSEYREVHRIRSSTHPVPHLKSHDGWLEAPFWLWRDRDRVRGRLFVKPQGRELALAIEREEISRIKLDPDTDAGFAVDQLLELQRQGFHLRTRALTTTLFARLFLSDLFIHGIGGAKYDEMTDRLMTRFYAVPPPEFLTLSATHLLPLASEPPPPVQELVDLQHRVRDVDQHPESLLSAGGDDSIAALLREKTELIAEQHRADAGERLGANRREHRRRGLARWRRLTEINATLSRSLDAERTRLTAQLAAHREALRRDEILRSREYSFCLFPAPSLRESMTRLQSAARGDAG